MCVQRVPVLIGPLGALHRLGQRHQIAVVHKLRARRSRGIWRPLLSRAALQQKHIHFGGGGGGDIDFTVLAAAITPLAITSHFMMPPKMLLRMPFTLK